MKLKLIPIVSAAILSLLVGPGLALADEHRVIMVTGYWNPTGNMIRQFSQNPELNPDGWQGENWEGRGYDIISYFPDPDAGYTGDFEVDYQDTSADFWYYTGLVQPIAVVSFGAGNGPWEIEYNARNITSWIPDNEDPTMPTPNPPDDSVPVGYVRNSTLPVQEIADRVNGLNLPGIGLTGAWVDWSGNPGAYLCEYIAYHGMWYQDLYHSGRNLTCLMAGFTHVNAGVPLDSAISASEETLRAVIDALDALAPTPTATATPNGTATETPSPGLTATETVTPAATGTATATLTPTGTPTASETPTGTVTATATITITGTLPTATPSPTGTPPVEIIPDLELNDSYFTAGEPFLLTCTCRNTSRSSLVVDLYILLDVQGSFWFWPDWTPAIDYVTITVAGPDGLPEVPLLDFTWPAGAGSASGLGFWSAYFDAGTYNLVGECDHVTFAFGE